MIRASEEGLVVLKQGRLASGDLPVGGEPYHVWSNHESSHQKVKQRQRFTKAAELGQKPRTRKSPRMAGDRFDTISGGWAEYWCGGGLSHCGS